MVLNSCKNTYFLGLVLLLTTLVSCAQKESLNSIISGSNQTNLYLPLLKGKRVGIVANQTSVIFMKKKQGEKNQESNVKNQKTKHLVDSLLLLNILVKRVFAPEHGFRGKADAGETIHNGIDAKTSLPIISLYGKHKKPAKEHLQDLDVIVFDIQDVGVRFYTYISTLHYVMEACAENNIPLIVLDRPNPNGHFIDGPVLEPQHKSFVGMHPVPVVYGMTIGEYAQMINGEGWLANQLKCNLTVISLQNYTHSSAYSLLIKPSPNLPNAKSINLYPSLCFFEGTSVSVGRGTNMQFQIVGSPYYQLKRYGFEFTPRLNEGAKYPKHQNKTCYGYDLRNEVQQHQINLSWLLDFYKAHKESPQQETFFNSFFTKLAGTKKLQQQIEQGWSEKKIKGAWQKDLVAFKKIRSKYLLY